MEKIKIYLQYPWKFPDSPYYKYLVNSPPEGIEYLNTKKQKGVITNISKFKLLNKLKSTIRNTLNTFKISIPNSHLTKSLEKYDLIHCAHCLSKNRDKSWVADFEGGWQMFVGKRTKKAKEKVRKILTDENCKKIISWTNKAKEEVLKEFPEIKNKVELIYPAIPLMGFKKRGRKFLTIIYVARNFKIKGGILALEVMKRLKENYRIRSIVISPVPEKIRERYLDIEIYPLMPQKEVFNFMRDSDLFLYPSQIDTFGFSILEAMSFGLPSIALKTPATSSIEEIIKNGKNGYLIEYHNNKGFLDKISKEEEFLINNIFEKCEKLIKNKKLREKISKNCIKTIKSGKFSIKKRNKKLEKIYREALK